MKLTIKQIVSITNGELLFGDENYVCKSFSKDTREIKKEEVYVGIKGANFDGNSLFEEAFKKGAGACILEKDSVKDYEFINYGKPIILVDNSIKALKNIAEYVRDNSEAIFIGVTGSVGKTSTRDMIYSVVSKKYKSLKTDGNYNNNIGLPLTIMRLEDEKCAVIEMGMNNLKEIDYLSKITKPHIAVITNVGTAHIGNLGSRENILKAKLEIKNGLVSGGTLVINNDNDLLHEYYLNHQENIMTVGINNDSDVMATDIKIENNGIIFNIIYQNNKYLCRCPVASEVFVYNCLIAFAVGVLANVEIDNIIKGISDFELTQNRLDIFEIKNNIKVINDCYNASLDSMISSISLLKNTEGKRKIAVLGSMLELGKYSKELHIEVGKCVFDNKIDILITVGDDAKYIGEKARSLGLKEVYCFDNNNDAITKLKNILNNYDVVLVKASNGLKFIEIINALKDFK